MVAVWKLKGERHRDIETKWGRGRAKLNETMRFGIFEARRHLGTKARRGRDVETERRSGRVGPLN
jgi:hypothetical protein